MDVLNINVNQLTRVIRQSFIIVQVFKRYILHQNKTDGYVHVYKFNTFTKHLANTFHFLTATSLKLNSCSIIIDLSHAFIKKYIIL